MGSGIRNLVVCATLLSGVNAPAQTPAPEMASHDEVPSFKSGVNLVLVPVVVRDSNGKVIQNLTKADFQLFDKGKLREITKFSIEKPAPAAQPKADAISESAPKDPGVADGLPDHYIAYLFDDVHLNNADLIRARDAAGRHMDQSLRPADRAAIYTTSGRVSQEFTDDRAKLHQTLLRLRARAGAPECPDLDYYTSDQIVNRNDQLALQFAVAETLVCAPGAPPEAIARSTAQRVVSSGEQETHVSFTVLIDVVRRMAYMPGLRSIILVSPGYYTSDEHRPEESEVIEKALHSNVAINSLDARGLYTDSVFDASRRINPANAGIRSLYESNAARADGDVLAELSYGTGGALFQNSNDLDAGFKKVAATPDCIYVLGFSPENLKLDGSFHALKVRLASSFTFDLQARKGYYAPRHLTDAAETAKQEIQEAVFSREEMHDLPVDLNTQFFRASDTQASLSVLAHVGIRRLRYRKADGRNNNNLTVVAALFDRDGNYVKSIEKTVTMHLRDETLVKVPSITVKSSFDIPPGHYVVRLVVRDTEGELMAAENRAVEIPF